jgi:hypothetical protein
MPQTEPLTPAGYVCENLRSLPREAAREAQIGGFRQAQSPRKLTDSAEFLPSIDLYSSCSLCDRNQNTVPGD